VLCPQTHLPSWQELWGGGDAGYKGGGTFLSVNMLAPGLVYSVETLAFPQLGLLVIRSLERKLPVYTQHEKGGFSIYSVYERRLVSCIGK